MKELRPLLPYLRPHRKLLALGGICLLVAMPMQLFHPLVWKFIVDDVVMSDSPRGIDRVGGSRVNLLLAALGVMFVVYLAGAALSACRTWVLGVAGQRFVFDLRTSLYRHVQSQSLTFFHDRRSGDLIARVIGDVDALQEIIINGVDEIIASLMQFVLVAGIVIWLQPMVGMATLAPMILVFVALVAFNRRVKGLYRKVRDQLGDVSAKLQENLTGILVIKAFGRDEEEGERFAGENRKYLDTSLKAVLARALYFPSVMSVGFISNVVMIGLGGYFVIQGQFTVGGLVAYRGYWWYLFSPVQSLARINEMAQRAIAAAGRVNDLLAEQPEVVDRPDAMVLKDVAGRITFEHVGFAYDTQVAEGESSPTVLRDLSFELLPSQTLGIVGPSGAGKSTLLSLLMRLYDPEVGRITIDGHDLRDVTQASLRSQMAVVTQEPFLFNDTIANNIRYGREDASPAELEEAATLANAHEFITSLPGGYDAIVGERGVKLSGGQKQRLCIARAFLANPRILLLDEATSAVEPESESIIQAALGRLMEGRTDIVVSHRLSMVRDADLIVVIDEQTINERGRHDDLMAGDGWYARMYRLQMGRQAG